MNHFKNIEFIGWTHRPECNAWVDKIFDYYVLDYAESGNLLMQIGDEPVQKLKGPIAFLTFPGPTIKFGCRIGHWNHRFISFKGELAENFVKNGLFPIKTAIIPINNSERFSLAFDKLLNYMNNPKYGNSRASYMLEGLLLQLHEQVPKKIIMPKDPRILQTIEQITVTPEKKWNLQELATKSSLSYPHFRRLFIAATAMPPGSFIFAKRMEKAGKLLQQSLPPTLKETASLCGYEDIYHFSKSFSKFHKISPGRYRDNFQLR
ncbi:MAG: AraC family transcriptional regulator [Victivallales bacterium]|nr:AraC family transcriptional regulator [Victivallales bacterium]